LCGSDHDSRVSFIADQPMMNGDIAPSCVEPADVPVCESVDSETVKPSAERCRVSETGDQLTNHIEGPSLATSPMSESAGDCVSVSEYEDCRSIGMYDNTFNFTITSLLAVMCIYGR